MHVCNVDTYLVWTGSGGHGPLYFGAEGPATKSRRGLKLTPGVIVRGTYNYDS